jgi:hypothetical protein
MRGLDGDVHSVIRIELEWLDDVGEPSVKIQDADSGVAGGLQAEEGAYLADRHQRRFTGGTQRRLQIPTYPDVPYAAWPRCGSSRQPPPSGKASPWRPTVGIVRQTEVTVRETVLMRTVDYACTAAAASRR